MDLIDQLRADIDAGFSKTQLEVLIGLPKNSLSGVLNNSKQLSKKSMLKVKRFMEGEKPDPLSDFKVVSAKIIKKEGSTEGQFVLRVPEDLKEIASGKNINPTGLKEKNKDKEPPAGLSKTELFKWLKDNL